MSAPIYLRLFITGEPVDRAVGDRAAGAGRLQRGRAATRSSAVEGGIRLKAGLGCGCGSNGDGI